VRTMMNAVVHARDDHGIAAVVAPAVRLHVSVDLFAGARITVHGPLRDMVLLRLARTLDDEAAASLKRCPECGNPFVRTGRKKYCGRKCTNRATWKGYVKSGGAEESRRRFYAKYGWRRGGRPRGA
jgi:tRNA(Ile2) C34 agmatinyltransferase TiaS